MQPNSSTQTVPFKRIGYIHPVSNAIDRAILFYLGPGMDEKVCGVIDFVDKLELTSHF